ncbi:hypothetical protein QL285_097441 [Trifolium repens]|nr:hypothetical protein QL285_097441 [Trifolium repens]
MVQIFLPFFSSSSSSRSPIVSEFVGEPERQAIDAVNTTPSEEAKEKEKSSVEEPKDYANDAVNNINIKERVMVNSKQEKLGGDEENEGAEKVSLNVEDIKAEGELVQEALNAVVEEAISRKTRCQGK